MGNYICGLDLDGGVHELWRSDGYRGTLSFKTNKEALCGTGEQITQYRVKTAP